MISHRRHDFSHLSGVKKLFLVLVQLVLASFYWTDNVTINLWKEQQYDNYNNAKRTLNQQYYVPTLDDLNSAITWQDFCISVQKPNKDFSPFADKHNMKEFVANVAPNLTFSNEYAYVNSPKDITQLFLDELPDKYLMKATHMSGGILLVENRNTVQCLKTCGGKHGPQRKDETTADYLQRRCEFYLQDDYATRKQEMSYANIPRRCIFEEVLDLGTDFQDFKIFMFHGKPYIVTIVGNRFDGVQNSWKTPYTWEEFPWKDIFYGQLGGEHLVPNRPSFMDDMLRDSQSLYDKVKQNVPAMVHMRVDFFVYKGTYAFAEITFSHNNCKTIFEDDIPNRLYGYIATHPDVNIQPDTILDLQSMVPPADA